MNGSNCRLRRWRGRRGFSLLEMLIALGLTALVYGLVSYSTGQISHVVRDSEQKLTQKKAVVNVAERLRWQLRCAYKSSSTEEASRPASNVHPATLKGVGLYGVAGDQTNRDVLLFRTTSTKQGRGGTVEVGYTILQDGESREPYLAYREYPWVDPLGLHTEEEDPNAPWEVCSRAVRGMSVEYSSNGEIWQQQWTDAGMPMWVRITLFPNQGAELVTVVGIGMVAPRW